MTDSSAAAEDPTATVQPDPETGEFREVTELLHAGAGDVSADRVTIQQSSAGKIEAATVDVQQSAIRSVSANEARLEQSAALSLTSADTAFHDSAAGIVSAERIDLIGSTAGIIRGPVTVAEGATSRIFLQIGGGDNRPQPVLSGQSALGLGAGIGLTTVLISRLLRKILGS